MGAEVEGTVGPTWIWLRSTPTPPSATQRHISVRIMMISCVFRSSALGCVDQAPALRDAQRCPEGIGGSPADRTRGELAEGSEEPHT